MKIVNLKAKNFWSFAEMDFTFEKGLHLVDGFNFDENSSNGSGKSAFLNAVSYAIFGDIPKKVKSDDIINRHSGKECIVTVEIQDGETHYLISRGRKPNFLKFFINGVVNADIDAKQTQKLIESKLGISFSTFVNSVYFAQNASAFLFANDEQKKAILTDILDLHVFDRAEETIRQESNAKSVEASKLGNQIQLLNHNLRQWEVQIVELQTKSKYFSEDKIGKIENVKAELANLDKEISEFQSKADQLKSDRVLYEREYEDFKKDYDAKEKGLALLSDAIYKMAADIRICESDLAREKSVLSKYGVQHKNCPTCFQDVNFELLEKLRSEQEQKCRDIQTSLDQLTTQYKAMPTKNAVESKKKEIYGKEQQLRTAITQAVQAINNNCDIITRLANRKVSLSANIEKLEAEENPYVSLIDDLVRKNDLAKEEIQKVKILYDETEKQLKDLQDLREVFSNKGIKSYVFDTVVNELNTYVNSYLSRLFSGNVRVQFLSEKEDSKGVIKQSLSTKLYVNNEEVSISSFSGGEERRIIFALNLALSNIISNRVQKKISIMLFDEAFDGLDFEGKRLCMELLSELIDSKDSIFVIDHSSEFQTMFDRTVKIEKRDGMSRIV